MDKQLKGLFGGGEAEVAEEKDFVQRYTTGSPHEGYTKQEAEKYLKASVKKASPEQIQRAFTASINNLPESDRAQFNEMLQQRQQGKGMVDIDRSGNRSDASAGSSGGGDAPGLDDLLGGLLGGSSGGSSGGGLDDILGGLLGGGSAGSGGAGFDDLLGGLLGGEQKGDQQKSGEQKGGDKKSGGGDSPGGMLESLMDNPLAGAVLAGVGAFLMKELLN